MRYLAARYGARVLTYYYVRSGAAIRASSLSIPLKLLFKLS